MAPDIAAARAVVVGRTVAVQGVVVAEAGRTGVPGLAVIADGTGGLPVRLPSGQPLPARGTLVLVRGVIAAPYGQTELRVTADGLTILGMSTLPEPSRMTAGALGEATEGRLVVLRGKVKVSAARSTGGDLVLSITGDDGRTARLYADASAGLTAALLRKGTVATFTGIVGQHATRRGALDGYRLWLRDRADVAIASPAPATGGSSAGAAGSGTAGLSGAAGIGAARTTASAVGQGPGLANALDVDIADVGGHLGARIRIGGRVTALRPDGVDLDDGTGSLRLVLAGGAADLLGLLEPGDILNATGVPERRAGIVVIVRDAADVVLVGDLGAGPDPADTPESGSPATGASDPSPTTPATQALRAGFAAGPGADPATTGVGTLVLGAVVSLLVAGARRLRARRVTNARIIARLTTYASAVRGAPGGSFGSGRG